MANFKVQWNEFEMDENEPRVLQFTFAMNEFPQNI